MAKNPNEIPPWLLDDDDDESASGITPPGSGKAAPPPPPPPPAPRSNDPAPWLADFDDETSTDEMLKGAGLNRDWLASGDFLAASAETELTYDEWYARQQEARREKDIEEEVPDLLNTGELDQPPPADADKGTGSLPDWFLGMESLSPEEEPEWMKTGDKFASEHEEPIPTVPDEDVPSWMQSADNFVAAPIPRFSGFSADEDEQDDAIQAFFASLQEESAESAAPAAAASGTPDDEVPPDSSFAKMFDDIPYRSADSNEGATGLLYEDSNEPAPDTWEALSGGFGAAAAAAGYDTLPTRPEMPASEDDLDALFTPSDRPVITDPSMIPTDVDDLINSEPDASWFGDEPDLQYSGEDDVQPDSRTFGTAMLRDLDSFFGDVAASRESEPANTPVEDPDLSWFLDQPELPVTGTLPEPPTAPAEPEAARPTDTGTLSWLDELNSIVGSATRGENDPLNFADDDDEDFFTSPPHIPPPPALFDEIEPLPELPEHDVEGSITDIFNQALLEDFTADTPSAPPVPPPAAFDWESAEAVKDEELEPNDSGLNWLQSLNTGTLNPPPADAPPAEPLIPRAADAPPRGQPSGILRRFSEPEPAPSEPAEPESMSDELPDSDLRVTPETPLEDYDSLFGERNFDALDSEFVAPPSIGSLFGDEPEDTPPLIFPPEEEPASDKEVEFDLGDFYADMEDAGAAASSAEAEAAYAAYFPEEAEDDPFAPPTGENRGSTDFFSLIQNNPEANLIPVTSPLPPPVEAGDDVEEVLQLGDDYPLDEITLEEFTPDYSGFEFEAEEAQPSAPDLNQLETPVSAFGGTTGQPDAEDLFADLTFEDQPAEAESAPPAVQNSLDDLFGLTGVRFDEEPEVSAPAPVDSRDLEPGDEFASILAGLDELPPAAPAEGAETIVPDTGFFDQIEANPGANQLDQADLEAEPLPSVDDFFADLDASPPVTPAFVQPDADLPPANDFFASFEDEASLPSAPAEPAVGSKWDTLPVANDFFSSFDEPDFTEPPRKPLESEGEDDFFSELRLDQTGAEADALPPANDFFASFEYEDEGSAAPAQPDFFADLAAGSGAGTSGSGSTGDTGNFFASLSLDNEQPPADSLEDALEESDNFFANLGVTNPDEDLPDLSWANQDQGPTGLGAPLADDRFGGQKQPPGATIEPAFDDVQEDFLDDLGYQVEEVPSASPNVPSASSTPAFSNLDEYLSSLSTTETPGISDEAAAIFDQSDVDLDKLFTEGLPAKPAKPAASDLGDLQPPVGAEWLSEIQNQVGDVSASAILRQRKDRPEGELSDRLKRLRQREKAVEEKIATGEYQPLPEQASKRRRRRDEAAVQPEVDPLKDVLPGTPALAPAPIQADALTLGQSVTLTPEQQSKVGILRSMIRSESLENRSNRLSAIDMTYDTPFLRDLEDNENAIVHPRATGEAAAPAQERVIAPVKIPARRRYDRLILALLIILAMLAPFFISELQIGEPPTSITDGSPGAIAAFASLDGVRRDDYVLIAVEYGPASAGELDRMTDALVRHALLKGARPVIISTNPFGVLRTGNLIRAINQDMPFLTVIDAPDRQLLPNLDYYLIRYLAGGAIGLRDFAETPAAVLAFDIEGDYTGLQARRLADFSRIIVIADTPDDLRLYAEQVAPLTDAPLIAAASYAAAPAAESYTGAALVFESLLVGGQDAALYQAALDRVRPVQRGERIATPTPTPMPTQTADPAPTGESAAPLAESTPEAQAEGSEGGTPDQTMTITVISDQPVNVRSGAGTDFNVLTTASPGETLAVLDFSADGEWVQVRLDDGREGWINSRLVQLNMPETGDTSAGPNAKGFARQGDEPPTRTPRPLNTRAATATPDVPTATRTPRPTSTDAPQESTPTGTADDAASPTGAAATRTPRPSRTPLPTGTPAAEATDATAEVTAEAAALDTPVPLQLTFDTTLTPAEIEARRSSTFYMGILASSTVIVLGAVVNIVRGLRRGRQR